jgi:cell division protein FtsQ
LVKKRRSRHTRRRAGAVAVAALVAAFLWIGVPHALARVPMFRVRQIDLVGVKYLAPDALIAALRLPAGASVFGDAGLLADRVKGVSGVADASVERRLPGTLEVLVSEVEPAAFAPGKRGGSLVAVDGAGRPLPFDPERTGLDLPIVGSADAGAVSVLALVQAVDPALFQRITGARSSKRGDVLLELGAHRRVWLRRDAGPETVRAVALVGQDLAVTGRAYTELDARFAGQVIVRQQIVVRQQVVVRQQAARGKGSK